MPTTTLVSSRWRAFLLGLLAIFVGGCGQPTRNDAAGDVLPAHAVVRLGSTRFQPYSSSTDLIEYSPDGRYVATVGLPPLGTVDCGVQIWDRTSGRDVTPAGLKRVQTEALAWAPTGNRFVTTHIASKLSSALNIWMIGRDRPEGIAPKDQYCSSVAWSPTGERIAVRTSDEVCLILDNKGVEKHRMRLPQRRKSFPSARVLAFSPDGKRLAVPSAKGLQIRDVVHGTIMTDIFVDSQSVNAIRFLLDDKSIAVAGDDHLRIINIDSRAVVLKLGPEVVFDFVVSKKQDWVATTGYGSLDNLSIWDLKSGELLLTSPEPTNVGIALSPDDLELAISTRRISFLSTANWKQLPAHDEQRHSMSCGLLYQDRFWTGEFGNQVREWDLSSGKPLDLITVPAGTTRSLAIIDDQQLAVAGNVPEIGIYDVKSHQLRMSLGGHQPHCAAAISAPSSHRLISASGGQTTDNSIRGWDLNTMSQVFEISTGDSTAVPVLAMAPSEKYFISSIPLTGELRRFSTADGAERWTKLVADRGVLFAPVAISPDSRHVFCLVEVPQTGFGKGIWVIRCLDAETGDEQSRLEGAYLEVIAIAISPDGRFAAASIRDSDGADAIQIWSLANRSRVATLKGHHDWAAWLGFTPDSERLISLSKDATGLVWDVESAIANQAGRRK